MVSLNSARTALVLTIVAISAGSVRAEKWAASVAQGEQQAKQLDVPLLLHFYADWCGPCRGMERNVLHNAAVTKRLGRTVVGVKVNSDKHRDLVSRYGIRALPSDVVIDPSGKVLLRSEGVQSAAAYGGWLDRSAGTYARTKSTRIASNPSNTGEDNAPKPMTGGPEINPLESGVKTAAPMLDGYSPVALANAREWIAGRPEFAAEHQGMRYLLASAEELATFEDDPRKYAPKLLGCDPVLLYEDDRALEGSTKYGAFFDGNLYLFTSADTRNRFREKPYRYTRTQHVLNAGRVVRQ